MVDTSGRSHRNEIKISEIKGFADIVEYDVEYDVDDDIEDDRISEEQEAFLIRTQELAIDLFVARDRARIAQRKLEDHLGDELKNSF